MNSKNVEDYLETVYNLVERKGIARTGDISRALDVQPPSVTEMLRKLAKEGLVTYRKYGGAKLTVKGEELARSIKGRHEALVTFLDFLGLDEEIAEEDACKIEHDLNPQTARLLQKFLESLKRP